MSFNLSKSERLLIHRRRLGYTQAKAARRWKLQAHIYGRMECGDADTLARHPVPKVATLVPKDHERCLIMRRRCHMTQTEIAKALNVSRYWLNLMELGKAPCDDLLWFWEN